MEISKAIQGAVADCVAAKYWRSACEKEVQDNYAKSKAERAEIAKYVREQYAAAGAGSNGRWQVK